MLGERCVDWRLWRTSAVNHGDSAGMFEVRAESVFAVRRLLLLEAVC